MTAVASATPERPARPGVGRGTATVLLRGLELPGGPENQRNLDARMLEIGAWTAWPRQMAYFEVVHRPACPMFHDLFWGDKVVIPVGQLAECRCGRADVVVGLEFRGPRDWGLLD